MPLYHCRNPMTTKDEIRDQLVTIILQEAGLTDDVIQELLEIYSKFDKDGDGLLTFNDMKHVLASFGETPTEETVQDIFKDADYNGDGVIDFGEFTIASVRGPWGQDDDSELVRIMNTVNKQKQAQITLKDLSRCIFNIGEKLANERGILSPQSSIVEEDDFDDDEFEVTAL